MPLDLTVLHLIAADLIALHLGSLHAHEQWLVLAIAFAPFVVLGIVVTVQRRRAIAEDERTEPRS